VRGHLNQIYRYALVKVPGLEINYAADLDVVAIPRPPARHHPFLRMDELPELLRAIEEYEGAYQTRRGVRLLLLTCVRTCELRRARPEQFDLERELWIIPSGNVKQLSRKKRKTRKAEDIPPYLAPLSRQAMTVVRDMPRVLAPSQRYISSFFCAPPLPFVAWGKRCSSVSGARIWPITIHSRGSTGCGCRWTGR
jgi:integrase